MLGKLMKYEFKATGRIFLPLFGALLIVALINRVFIELNFKVPMIIGTTMSSFMIGAVCVVALVLTIQRFYRNLLKSEGYLMFTLPVTTDGLIWSKLIVAAIWTVVSFVAVTLALLVMTADGLMLQHIRDAISNIIIGIKEFGFQAILYMVEALVLMAETLLCGILLVYTCLALSLLVNKHRIGFAFLMYIVITTLLQVVAAIGVEVFRFVDICALIEHMSGFGQIQTALGAYFLAITIPGAIFYFLTRYMLQRRLNLE
ncbi:hypothetical protein AAFA46_09705 [Oscillospiraceae bacterium WX1]